MDFMPTLAPFLLFRRTETAPEGQAAAALFFQRDQRLESSLAGL